MRGCLLAHRLVAYSCGPGQCSRAPLSLRALRWGSLRRLRRLQVALLLTQARRPQPHAALR